MIELRFERYLCSVCGHSPDYNGCQLCFGTGFKPNHQAQHERMRLLLDFARQYDISTNPEPLAVFGAGSAEAGSAGFQVWATPSDYPAGPWVEVADKMATGAFSKPCAYVGSAYWVWEDKGDGAIITAIGIETDAYILRDHRLVAQQEIRNRPDDITWLKQKITWLWRMSEATWAMPPIVIS